MFPLWEIYIGMYIGITTNGTYNSYISYIASRQDLESSYPFKDVYDQFDQIRRGLNVEYI